MSEYDCRAFMYVSTLLPRCLWATKALDVPLGSNQVKYGPKFTVNRVL